MFTLVWNGAISGRLLREWLFLWECLVRSLCDPRVLLLLPPVCPLERLVVLLLGSDFTDSVSIVQNRPSTLSSANIGRASNLQRWVIYSSPLTTPQKCLASFRMTNWSFIVIYVTPQWYPAAHNTLTVCLEQIDSFHYCYWHRSILLWERDRAKPALTVISYMGDCFFTCFLHRSLPSTGQGTIKTKEAQHIF